MKYFIYFDALPNLHNFIYNILMIAKNSLNKTNMKNTPAL